MMPNQLLPSLQPEEWLTERLTNVGASDPHYEASWYGPYNALLSHYFPYQQRFLIKPQPRIRHPFIDDGDFSFSSIEAESSIVMDGPITADTDAPVTSFGGLARHSGFTFIPDFIVAKATKFTSQDTALLLVEVKVREPATHSAKRSNSYQMNKYMSTLVDQMLEGAKLVGLLVCGTDVTVCRGEGASQVYVEEAEIAHNINSPTIRELLLGVAQNNWDY